MEFVNDTLPVVVFWLLLLSTGHYLKIKKEWLWVWPSLESVWFPGTCGAACLLCKVGKTQQSEVELKIASLKYVSFFLWIPFLLILVL